MSFDDVIGEVVPDLADFGILAGALPPRPAGDPTALRAAAGSWTALATELRDLIWDTDAQVVRLAAQWQGPAKDAFMREWSGLVSEADEACDQLSGVGGQLDQAADVLQRAQREWLVAMWATVATTLAGVALSFVPLGEEAAGAAAETIAEEFALSRELSQEAAELIGAAVRVAVQIAERIVAKFVILFGVNLGVQAAVSGLEYHTLSYVDLREAAGEAIAGSAPGTIPVGNTAVKMIVTGGLQAGFEAAGQEAKDGHIDPLMLLFVGLKGASGPGSAKLSQVIREWLANRG